MSESQQPQRLPGECFPYEEKKKEILEVLGDPQVVEKMWKDIDGLGYMYIWFCLLAF